MADLPSENTVKGRSWLSRFQRLENIDRSFSAHKRMREKEGLTSSGVNPPSNGAKSRSCPARPLSARKRVGQQVLKPRGGASLRINRPSNITSPRFCRNAQGWHHRQRVGPQQMAYSFYHEEHEDSEKSCSAFSPFMSFMLFMVERKKKGKGLKIKENGSGVF